MITLSVNPQLITGDNVEHEIVFDESFLGLTNFEKLVADLVVKIQAKTGTFQFNTNGQITADSPVFTAGETLDEVTASIVKTGNSIGYIKFGASSEAIIQILK